MKVITNHPAVVDYLEEVIDACPRCSYRSAHQIRGWREKAEASDRYRQALEKIATCPDYVSDREFRVLSQDTARRALSEP